MSVPTAAELLAAWERCLPLSPVERAVALLELARPGELEETITAMPVGSRDRELLRLRVSTFGTQLAGLACCPNCGQTVELAADANDIIAAAGDAEPDGAGELTLDRDDYHLRFRLPNSADLFALAGPSAGGDLERLLLGRCLARAEYRGQPVGAAELPAGIVETVASRMAEGDPLADIQLVCGCPDCGTTWTAPLDVPEFLWAELSAFARRLLHEVHVLASGYGWREAEILALSPLRRQAYLDLVAG